MGRINPVLRSLRSFMAAAPPRWWPPTLARRVFPLMAAPNPSDRRVCRFPHGSRNMASGTGVKGEELGKPGRHLLIPSAKDIMVSVGELSTKEFIRRHDIGHPAHGEEVERVTLDAIYGERDVTGETVDISVRKLEESCLLDGVGYMDILPNSSHRDGSIYRGIDSWKSEFRIADRNETWLKAKMLSDTTNCIISNGTCVAHPPCPMLQFFSLKLAKIPAKYGSIELYGYIAARDNLDMLLNYVVNFSRDDPLIVKQGSLINMAGPKRGIELYDTILIEYDMRIKIGDQEKEDLQLIDGVSIVDDHDTWDRDAFTSRIYGDCGAIEITASRLNNAVEAIVEVAISEVQGSFSMCLGCFSSGLQEEIRLFDGAIDESRSLKRSVVAVVMGTQMDLKFKVGAGSSVPAEHCCSFKAYKHGLVTQEVKTDFALISVKVTWLPWS